MDGNYIKISRSILEWEWYSDINTCRLFIHMLLKANWKNGKFKGLDVPRGSFVSSIVNLSEETQLTQREVRTAISHLKTTGEVTSKSTSKFTVFSIKNYDLYQTNDRQNDIQATNERHSNDIQTTTIEESNKERKKEEEKKRDTNVSPKKENPVYFPGDDVLDAAFADFVAMRKQIKKPMTDRAATLAINKLRSLATPAFSDCMDNDLAIQILNQSVMNCWQGLFPLKEDGQPKRQTGGIDWSNV